MTWTTLLCERGHQNWLEEEGLDPDLVLADLFCILPWCGDPLVDKDMTGD